MPSVSLTVNTCVTDIPFLEKTLRHVFRSLNFPFTERLIAYDPGNPQGKYESRRRGDPGELLAIFERLKADGLIDRVDTIPWDEQSQTGILKKYFGRTNRAERFLWRAHLSISLCAGAVHRRLCLPHGLGHALPHGAG